MTFDISRHLTFDIWWHWPWYNICLLTTFDISRPLTFQDIWHFMTTLHDVWHYMTFDISWHLTFSPKSCSSPSHLESLTQRFDTQPGQPDTKVSETKFLGWGEGGRWMWGWGVIHTVFKWLTLAKMFMSCSSMTVDPNVNISWARRPPLAQKGGHMLTPQKISSEWLWFW